MLRIGAGSRKTLGAIRVYSHVVAKVRPIAEKSLTVDTEASYDRRFGSETLDTPLKMGDVKLNILHGFDQRRFRCKLPGIGGNVPVIPLADLRGVVHRGHLWSIRCAPREAVGVRQTRLNASGPGGVDMRSRGLECILLSIVDIRQQDTSAPMVTHPAKYWVLWGLC